MKKTGLRLALLMLVLVTALGFIPQSASAAYENTHVNTGNYRQDLIAVALTQVGYRAVDGGNNNKYGASFGANYNPWCGFFISWCANQAKIPTSILKRTGYAAPGNFGIPYYSGNEYTPQPGDLFFQIGNNGVFMHVGLVVQVDAAKGVVYTVEGNTWDSSGISGVYRMTRSIRGNVFGVPDYGDGGAQPHEHTYGNVSYESAHPHKAYKSCKLCGIRVYTGATQTVAGCQSCCSHTYGTWSNANSNAHQHTCTKCGYKETKNHSWGNDTVVKAATSKEVGTKKQTCSVCGATRTTEIPKVEEHKFGTWKKINEESHQRVCTICGTKEIEEHELNDVWQSNAERHWHLCEICDGHIEEETHTKRDYCTVPCKVCQYVKPDGHVFEETYSWDETFHFRQCMFCPGQTDITLHDISQELTAEAETHYYACSGCDYQKNLEEHHLSDPATEEHAQVCLDCGFEYAPKLPHIHSFQPMQKDWEYHWSVCRCGKEYPKEPHKISSVTGLCTVCLEVPPEKPVPTPLEWITEKATVAWEFTSDKCVEGWMFLSAEENRMYLYIAAGGAVLVLSGLTTMIVQLTRRAKKKKKAKEPVA